MSATDAVQAAAAPTLADIRAARERIAGRVRHTPLLASETLGRELGAQLYFKCENLQEAGAFKVRGATNALFSLSPEALAAGVVTHSSGNHGAAVARAGDRGHATQFLRGQARAGAPLRRDAAAVRALARRARERRGGDRRAQRGGVRASLRRRAGHRGAGHGGAGAARGPAAVRLRALPGRRRRS